MKLLIGPCSHDRFAAPAGTLHNLVYFGSREIQYEIGMGWGELFGRLPAGWKPDCILWIWPEYMMWPAWEQCPVPLATVVGDWHYNFSALSGCLHGCDYIFADRLGTRRLQEHGIDHVEWWPAYGHSPDQCQRRNEAPLFDVTFIGRLNFHSHRTRSRYLAKLALFKEHYRVRIARDIHGPDYFEALARSRIVVNDGVRGEMNMRAYEATACGALLFMHADNLEISEFLRDGKDCVYFEEDNLLSLLTHYLKNESLRRRVADSGWHCIQQHTSEQHMADLIGRLEQLDFQSLRRDLSGFWSQPDAELAHLASRGFMMGSVMPVNATKRLASYANQESRNDWNALNTAAVMITRHAFQQHQDGNSAQSNTLCQQAASFWQSLHERWPERILSWANYGLALLTLGRSDDAASFLLHALELMEGNGDLPSPDNSTIFFDPDNTYLGGAGIAPPTGGTFHVEWERIASGSGADPETAKNELRQLVFWECARKLGGIYLANGNTSQAIGWLQKAVNCRPDLEQAHDLLGNALVETGDLMAATKSFERSLEIQPWNFKTRQKLADTLGELNLWHKQDEVCREGIQMANAFEGLHP
ncbi:MAG: glycosyltransferase [Verrucomicrobiota bacterium]|jgi:tetratricopeptide (TPR) repeat protein|nr:glycosyltransferase [Verrucomicrobiota bacterium]